MAHAAARRPNWRTAPAPPAAPGCNASARLPRVRRTQARRHRREWARCADTRLTPGAETCILTNHRAPTPAHGRPA
eukprot:7316171-Lingulodinium_polyedra.AAC.1